MASTILYKFRSGTAFEALPLPGSAARLFDVKKAIVKAKKLDVGSMEFDLAVRNADTQEEYANESMLLPRGTRLIVQRLPAARGNGFLARMARNEHGGTGLPSLAPNHATTPGSAPSGFYTIESRAADEDEFVQGGQGAEEKELAALQAVTAMQSTGPAMVGGYTGGGRGGPAGQGPPGMKGGPPKQPRFLPNADPELREQEKKMQPKKRATGIPRTFLNLNAPPQTDGTKEGEGDSNVPLLQPNTQGFAELVNRGGGQSENTAGTKRNLDYALKLTATSIPEHLQCGICQSVVNNAMILPWDPEGRTTCETCIRDGLTQNGFRCPLTGMDGVSPDDLIPNIGLRKAVDLFIKEVMNKIDEIEKQQVEEAETTEDANKSAEANILDGDGVEKGVIVSKKMTMAKRKEDDDPFGGGADEFGGDVFAVETEKPVEEEPAEEEKPKAEQPPIVEPVAPETEKNETKEVDNDKNKTVASDEPRTIPDTTDNQNGNALSISTDDRNAESHKDHTPEKQAETPNHRERRDHRRRGLPAGYAMGPAGGAVGAARAARQHQEDDHGSHGRSPSGGGRGFSDRGGFRGRGGRGRGRFGGRGGYDGNYEDRGQDDDSSRASKRSREDESESYGGGSKPHKSSRRDDDRHGDGDRRRDDSRGRDRDRDYNRDRNHDRDSRGEGGRGHNHRDGGGHRGGGRGGGRSYMGRSGGRGGGRGFRGGYGGRGGRGRY